MGHAVVTFSINYSIFQLQVRVEERADVPGLLAEGEPLVPGHLHLRVRAHALHAVRRGGQDGRRTSTRDTRAHEVRHITAKYLY